MVRVTEAHKVKQLINKLDHSPGSIHWWDLISNPVNFHSAGEREQVLQTGTAGHQADPSDMYRGWQRPWFFWTVLIIGAILIVSCFALVYGCQLLLDTTTQVAVEMLFLVPPMVIPVVLMVFFWELNVPRNLTIWELLACFLVGTLLSLGGNALMFALVGTAGGPMAALREEPAKLLAGVLLLLFCSKVKGKKICGLTGLAIGAAIGSGFSAFETISYGLQYDLETIMVRMFFAVVGHTLYSCSYIAALALHAPNGRITARSFFNVDFLSTFGCSVFCHGLWNVAEIPLVIRFAVTSFLLWYSALRMLRKALLEVRTAGSPPFGMNHKRVQTKDFSYIELRCLRGESAGQKWTYPISQCVTVGRGRTNNLCLPNNISGISRNHCYLEARAGAWMVTDVHSTYGTYLQFPGESIYKLVPGKQYPVASGALLYLGSQNFCIGISVF